MDIQIADRLSLIVGAYYTCCQEGLTNKREKKNDCMLHLCRAVICGIFSKVQYFKVTVIYASKLSPSLKLLDIGL